MNIVLSNSLAFGTAFAFNNSSSNEESLVLERLGQDDWKVKDCLDYRVRSTLTWGGGRGKLWEFPGVLKAVGLIPKYC